MIVLCPISLEDNGTKTSAIILVSLVGTYTGTDHVNQTATIHLSL
jgi:hypothetical protein